MQCTSVKVKGTPDRSKGAEVMWTGWSARCGLFSRNNVLRKSCRRWVKGGSRDECLYLYMCVWETERTKDKTRTDDMYFGPLDVLFLHQTSAKNKATLNITYWQLHQHFCSAYCEITPTKTISQTETKNESEENQGGLLSIWDTNTPCYWKRLETQTFSWRSER